MGKRTLNNYELEAFQKYLLHEEKSASTIEKYIRDLRAFLIYTGGKEVSKEVVINYKKNLQERGYAVRSINSMLASLHSFFAFKGWTDCRVRSIRLQKHMFCSEEKELTKAEYLRILGAARKNIRLNLAMQTICATGIRVSELQFFTIDMVKKGKVIVQCKGKTRTILIPSKLRKRLLAYGRKEKINGGRIFQTKRGNPLNRKTIWAEMKSLCKKADVDANKVFPHNLRKLFARSFYELDRDIAKLADLLGHSSIETTRIYIMTTDKEHREKMELLGLVV